MKRYLIIARTYYQLILSIQLRLTLFSEDEVVLLLSDDSINSKEVCKRIQALNIFTQAAFVKMKGVVVDRSYTERIIDFYQISFCNNNRYKRLLQDVDNKHFDEILCHNNGIDTIGLFSFLCEYNPNVKVSLFEEGVLSYGVSIGSNHRRKIIRTIRTKRHKKDISDSLSNFYCFFPELYHGALESVKIPLISAESICADTLRKVFYLDKNRIEYPQKYIFFSSVYDFEGGKPIGEFELVKRISEIVGQNNLIVKKHPRDTRTVFEDAGLLVDKNSQIPWEAIQLSGDFSNHCFMTATSGSVLAGSFMSEKPVLTLYLYKLCDISENQLASTTYSDIENLLSNREFRSILYNVKIIENIDYLETL